MGTLAWIVGPIIGGTVLNRMSAKTRGKNGRNFLKFSGLGTWLLLLRFLPIVIVPPVAYLHWINIALRLLPSAICYLLAVNSLISEARSQQRGEFTEAV